MRDDTAAFSLHCLGGSFALHDRDARRESTILELLLGDLAFGEHAQEIVDGSLGEAARDVASRENTDGDATVIGDQGLAGLEATLGQSDADALQKRSVKTSTELSLELGISLVHQLLEGRGAGTGGDQVQADLTFLIRRISGDGLTHDVFHQVGVCGFVVDAHNIGLVEVTGDLGKGRASELPQVELVGEILAVGGNKVDGWVRIIDTEGSGRADENNSSELHGCENQILDDLS